MIDDAVILVAGTGSRLKPLTNRAPKCLTEVNGVPILINTLQNLDRLRLQTCTIVTGYLSDVVSDTVGSRSGKLKIEYIYNDLYEKTNDMYSLWLAREKLEKGTLLIEGDIFFRAETLIKALSSTAGKSCYIAGKYDGRKNEILISTGRTLRIDSIEVLKNRQGGTGNNKYMSSGILVIQRDYGVQFSRWLAGFIGENRHDVLFDEVLSEHTGDYPLYVYEIDRNEWVEIDTKEDLNRAEAVFF